MGANPLAIIGALLHLCGISVLPLPGGPKRDGFTNSRWFGILGP
jgi:hypothetical protein